MLVKQYLIFKLSLDYEEFSSMMKRRNELISIGGVVSFHIHMKFDVFSNHMWFWISKLILLSGRNANVNAHYVTYLHTHRTNPWTKSTPNYGCLLNLKNVTFRSGEYERCSWTVHDTLPIYYILIDIVQSLSYQWYDVSLYRQIFRNFRHDNSYIDMISVCILDLGKRQRKKKLNRKCNVMKYRCLNCMHGKFNKFDGCYARILLIHL